jgi:hypothetical protein
MSTNVRIPQAAPIPLMGETPKEQGFMGNVIDGVADKAKKNLDVHAKLDNDGNFVSRANVGAPFKAWKAGTGNPLGSAIASAALLGGAAYMTTPWIAKKLRSLQGKLPEGMQHDVSDDEIASMRKRMAILAAITGGGLSVMHNFDKRDPVGSMTKWNYMNKQAMLGITSNPDVMNQDIIPLDHAKELVANDRYLTSGQKAAIGTIFDRTPDQKGNASMADITSGAIRAGLGFTGGAIAGYALGKIFALPASITRTASITGGLANALRTSGLIT